MTLSCYVGLWWPAILTYGTIRVFNICEIENRKGDRQIMKQHRRPQFICCHGLGAAAHSYP